MDYFTDVLTNFLGLEQGQIIHSHILPKRKQLLGV